MTLRVEAADPGAIVFEGRDDPAPQGPEIEAFADQVKGWLDGHLTDLQGGGDGALAEVAADGLLDGTSDTADGATTRLASPDEAVASALYHVVVLHSGEPAFARVTAYVRSESGRLATAGFLFTPEPLTLVAAGPQASP